MSLSDERMRILKMIEGGQVNAEDGAQLLEALGERSERGRAPARTRPNVLRVRVLDLTTHRQKVNVTIPINLVGVGLKLGARLAPLIAGTSAEEVLQAIESSATGRIFDMQDLEEGERIEIFVE